MDDSQRSSPSKRPRRDRREAIFERQSKEEKDRLAREYRELQAKIERQRTEVGVNTTASDLRQGLKNADRLFKKIKDTELANADARFFDATVETAANMTRKMKLGGISFDMDDFLSKVKATLGLDRALADHIDVSDDELEGDEETQARRRRLARRGVLGDWEKIGWMAAGFYRHVPGIEFMYGPLKVQHQKRVIARRARTTQIEKEVRPENIEGGRDKGEKSVTDTVKQTVLLRKTLDRLDPQRQGFNLFRLIVNPHDYAQTVENAFYISFLTRDGHAGIEVRPDGEILIRRTDPYLGGEEGELPTNQAVIELDMETWREAIATFNITEPAIPQRPKVQKGVPAANAWY
ncbi:hypothetical protein Q5752_000537 [Cryptotrichosporon argae]